jgi:hypothetical protein
MKELRIEGTVALALNGNAIRQAQAVKDHFLVPTSTYVVKASWGIALRRNNGDAEAKRIGFDCQEGAILKAYERLGPASPH